MRREPCARGHPSWGESSAAAAADKTEKQEKAIVKMRDALKSDDKVITFGENEYPRRQVESQLLAADVDTLITFQMRQGQVPAIIQVLLDIVQKQGQLPVSIAAMQAEGETVRAAAGSGALTEVEEGAVATLDLFFGSEPS